ncbi:cytochrome P450 [Streptomyces sioyaensis]|uniref:cytochrome P450 n=1 Tax=Streptomyces sioyaensis TaxID=67364 RepID=UPI0037B27470
MDTSHRFDRVLQSFPRRTGELAAPPAGSGLLPVRGDRGIPFVGFGIHTLRYGPAYQLQLLRRHGPVSWCQAFGRKVVVVSGPDAVQAVLANKDKGFATGWPDVIGPWFDGGLLAMNAPEHLGHRRLMQAAYGEEALDAYVRCMAEDAHTALERWPAGRRFAAVAAIRELSGQVTTRAILGLPYEPAGRRIMRAVEECIRAETAALRLRIPGTLWHRAYRARRQLLTSLTRAVAGSGPREGDDFLSVLSRVGREDQGRFDSRQIAEHTLFTLIASHDTTAAATMATVYFLGRHPEWQDRARAECLTGAETPPTAAALSRLETLDSVIKESIRLVSPSPINMRVTVKDTELLGHYLPAGQLVSVCTAVNQLLPELWDRPQHFDPERFAEGRNEERVHRLAWAPFGSGQHKCIGMHFGMLKVKATLEAMLRRFEWRLPDGYEAPWRFTSLPAPSDGLPVVLRPLRERPEHDGQRLHGNRETGSDRRQ